MRWAMDRYERQLTNRRPLDGRRVKARLIDFLVVLIPVFFLAALIGRLPSHWGLVLLALEVTYFFFCEATWGYTLGKYHQGLRVIKPDGSPPGVHSIAARNVIRVVEEPLLALLVMVFSGGRRQRIGDLVGTTAVGSVVFSDPPERSPARFAYPAIWIAGAVALGIVVVGPHERYMEQVNRTCAEHAIRGPFDVNPQSLEFIVQNTHSSAAAMAAIDPPAVDRKDHERLVEVFNSMDVMGQRALRAVRRSPEPARALAVEYPRLQAGWQSAGYDLAQLGLTCSA